MQSPSPALLPPQPGSTWHREGKSLQWGILFPPSPVRQAGIAPPMPPQQPPTSLKGREQGGTYLPQTSTSPPLPSRAAPGSWGTSPPSPHSFLPQLLPQEGGGRSSLAECWPVQLPSTPVSPHPEEPWGTKENSPLPDPPIHLLSWG